MNSIGFLNDDAIKVLISAVLGAILGLEREWSGKSAGFRTLMLVSMGATLFTIVSFNMARQGHHDSDVTRIASSVVTGIGFIGAGLIFKGEKSVHGLTTAATVWMAAAIGLAVGIGNYTVALVSTLAAWMILVLLSHVENLLENFIQTRDYEVNIQDLGHGRTPSFQDMFTAKGYNLVEAKTLRDGSTIIFKWTIRASKKRHEQLVAKLLEDRSVLSLAY